MNQKKDDDSASNANQEYKAEDLVRISDREHVRKRPGMYIGDTTGHGLRQLLEEVLELMLNCHRAGSVTRISVEAHPDQSITIHDDNNSCKLAIDKRLSDLEQREITNLECEVSRLHNSQGVDFFGASPFGGGGMRGISVACVNFLSSRFEIRACGESQVFRQSYLQGIPENPVEVTTRTDEVGTQIAFTPDPEIFSHEHRHRNFDAEEICKRLEMLSYLNAGLETKFVDQRTGNEFTYRFTNGIQAFLDRPPKTSIPIVVDVHDGDIEFEAAFEQTHDVVSYANNTRTFDKGTHVTQFFRVLAEVLNDFKKHKMGGFGFRFDSMPHAKDYELQLRGIISVSMSDPRWEGATKTRIANPELEAFADERIKPQLVKFFDDQPELARSIIHKAVASANARTKLAVLALATVAAEKTGANAQTANSSKHS